MLFWILLGIVAAAMVAAFIIGSKPYYGWQEREINAGCGAAFWVGVCASLVSGGIILLAAWIFGWTYQVTGVDQYGLHALDTPSQMHGEFFLGSGYIGSSQEFSFLQIHSDGAIQLGSIDPADAVVYEDGGKYMTITHATNVNPWILPFGIPLPDKWAFHVPKGSVDSSYNISPSPSGGK